MLMVLKDLKMKYKILIRMGSQSTVVVDDNVKPKPPHVQGSKNNICEIGNEIRQIQQGGR